MTPKEYNEGQVLLIDKPLKWTSFDVVHKVRNIKKIKKIGHAGTLDPLATGLLILCTGKKTKSIDLYQAQEKEYTGTLVFGKTTPSHDLETPFDAEFDVSHISKEKINEILPTFIGKIQQVPPIFSAIKVNGKRLYKQAHKGITDETIEIAIKSREVDVTAFELSDFENFPALNFRIVCSKGTYIRSLVRDLGKALGAGAYMSALRRTRIGEFSVGNALSLEDFLKENTAKEL